MIHQKSTSDEHKKGGQMMGNEDNIMGFEDKVVKGVHYEVRSAKFKYQVLKRGVL